MQTAFCGSSLPLSTRRILHVRLGNLNSARFEFATASVVHRHAFHGTPLFRGTHARHHTGLTRSLRFAPSIVTKCAASEPSVQQRDIHQREHSSTSATRSPEEGNGAQEGTSIEQLRDEYDRVRTESDSNPAPVANLVKSIIPFDLDDFQLDALRALSSGKSVVLSAPTGAGKTIVGEMAVYLALCKRLRVFYTTPLKALSNQKFYDFKRQFGDDRVGLLTGDITINRDADIIVMTTEIYRNMLYAEATETRNEPPVTDNLFAVIFDEFHYLNDRDRGTVWEESVINSPPHVVLVALSATMSNSTDVKQWFESVQGPTALVESHVRPVPLLFGYCDQDGLTPLFADEKRNRSSGGRTRGFAKSRRQRNEPQTEVKLHPKLLRKLNSKEKRDQDSKRRRPTRIEDDMTETEIMRIKSSRVVDKKRFGRRDGMEVPSFQYVVRTLQRREMTPCIVFIFSRMGCDRAAMSTANNQDSLVTPEEQVKIKERLDAFVKAHPGMVQPDRLNVAMKGIASHHAGLMPLWKICVEELFQDGLIKVVFATETLAAGINMPARSTVISMLSKRIGDEGFTALTTSQVLQMAGRAGRRGKDTIGHSIVLRSRREGAKEAFKILTAGVDALESKFTPNYGMVLNLLSTRSLEDAKVLVERSFGNFLRQKYMENRKGQGAEVGEGDDTYLLERAALESVFEDAKKILETVDNDSLRAYIKNLERVKAEKRALGYLVEQSANSERELIEDTLTFAPTGTRLLLKDRTEGPSSGATRRQKRREYSAAMAAAAQGDLGTELKSFYLGATDADVEDLDVDEEDVEVKVLEAILLDIHQDSPGILPVFAAIDGNGELRLFNHTAVVQLFYDEEPLNVEEYVTDWADVVLPGRTQWRSLTIDQYVAPLPTRLDGLVECVKSWRADRELGRLNKTLNDGGSLNVVDMQRPEILKQADRVRHAKDCVRKHALHTHEDIQMILAAKRAIPTIEATLEGAVDPFGNKRRKRRSRGKKYAERVTEKEKEKEKEVEDEVVIGKSSWDDFMSLVSVLQHYGFIDESYNVTSLGSLGAKIRAENELWTSVALLDPELEHISPMHLGALLGATQQESSRQDVYIAAEPSKPVVEGIERFSAERTRLFAVQTEFGVDAPVYLDCERMGLVEMWSSGMSWVEVMGNTSLQEGDAVRILRRVLDMLRQIQYLPIVGEGVKRNAKRSVALMDRFPVTDDMTYVVREGEKVSQEDENA